MTIKFKLYVWPEDGDLVLVAKILNEYLWSFRTSHYLYKSHPRSFGWKEIGEL